MCLWFCVQSFQCQLQYLMSTEQLLKDEFMSRFSPGPGHFKILIPSVTQTEHRHLRFKKNASLLLPRSLNPRVGVIILPHNFKENGIITRYTLSQSHYPTMTHNVCIETWTYFQIWTAKFLYIWDNWKSIYRMHFTLTWRSVGMSAIR
jgi:hypothetical protein